MGSRPRWQEGAAVLPELDRPRIRALLAQLLGGGMAAHEIRTDAPILGTLTSLVTVGFCTGINPTMYASS